MIPLPTTGYRMRVLIRELAPELEVKPLNKPGAVALNERGDRLDLAVAGRVWAFVLKRASGVSSLGTLVDANMLAVLLGDMLGIRQAVTAPGVDPVEYLRRIAGGRR